MRSSWDLRRERLLIRYERVALELFVRHGFSRVSVSDVATAAGVSARTLFRYFPTKVEFLLLLPRRQLTSALDAIARLAPSTDPAAAAWGAIAEQYLSDSPDLTLLSLWRRSVADAPEVVARVIGERAEALLDALTTYCAMSLDLDPRTNPLPRILAGSVVGVELAMMQSLGRSSDVSAEVVEIAARVLGVQLDRSASR